MYPSSSSRTRFCYVAREAAKSLCGTRQLRQSGLQQIKVDRLGEEFAGAEFTGATASLVITVRRHHHHRQIAPALLDRGEQIQSVRFGHIDVREDHDQAGIQGSPEESATGRCGTRNGLTGSSLRARRSNLDRDVIMSVGILVVDDEPNMAEMFWQCFRREARNGT